MAVPLSIDNQRLADQLRLIGCPGIVPLRTVKTDSPDQIPYLDLLASDVRQTAAILPDAVAEYQGRPVLYILDAHSTEPDAAVRLDLQQRLANRGDHGVLAIVRPGELALYPLNLDRKKLNEHGLGQTFKTDNAEAPFLFESLATGARIIPGSADEADPVFEEVKKLLKRAVQDLVVDAGLDGLSVLSMTGRALFFRFLIDRKIVDDSILTDICPSIKKGAAPHDLKAVFSTPERAAETSKWLDETFNGDLLPLCAEFGPETSATTRLKAYRAIYEEAGKQSSGWLFGHLEAILRGWEHVQGSTQPLLPIDWDDLNFRHIPVGVLSQVYENFSHQVDSKDSTDRSVHYTPRLLASLLVEQALAGVDVPAHEAHVLDPACGAGVFLVLALRELVRRRWQADRERLREKARRPSKAVIEGILHRQIRGFDISESALRLAALGLYITVIELNEITTPPSAHHASKALRNLVLFDQRTEEERQQSGFVNGSLGAAVARKTFDDCFDVVIGNPPWSRVEGVAKVSLDAAANQVAHRILRSRGLAEVAADYSNPGGIPDIPFLWRAMEWAKPGGIIGYALEARLILAQSNVATKARNAVFQSLSVTGILNGSDLEKTPVWGCHDQPWILLWARNEKPDLDDHTFHLLTPIRENELTIRGRFRMDYQSAYQISAKQVIETGWLCKALAIGSTLDVAVMEKMTQIARKQSIGSFWEDHGLESTRGVDVRPFKFDEKVNPETGKKEEVFRTAPEWLVDLEVFDGETSLNQFTGKYPTYRQLHGIFEPNNTRRLENFLSPVVAIRRAPGESHNGLKAIRLPKRTLAYSKNWIGYSAHGFKDSKLATATLLLLVHSSLFQHFCYMTSGQIGAKRRILDKGDIDTFPFPQLQNLDDLAKARINKLAELIDVKARMDRSELDSFVCELFGLTKAEQQVVADTVNFNGPYASIRQPAALPVPPEEASTFAKTLEQALQPFFKTTGQTVKAHVVPRIEGEWHQPWAFVALVLEGDTWMPSAKLLADVMAKASETMATRVVMPLPDGGLLLGLVNKRRFWTSSRARLCALHIANEHLQSCFPLPRKR